jgi:hypothetical protein
MFAIAPVSSGFGFPLGFAGSVVGTAGAIGAGAAGHHLYSLAALALALAAVSAVTTTGAALGSAVIAWALQDGFVLGREGQLVFSGEAGRTAVVLVAIALISVGLGTAVRTFRFQRRHLGGVGRGLTGSDNGPAFDKVG